MGTADEAFRAWAADGAAEDASPVEAFHGGWAARAEYDHEQQQAAFDAAASLADEERERTRVYWQTKVASVEAERDALIQRLATACYDRDSFRRARDMLGGMLERARVEAQSK